MIAARPAALHGGGHGARPFPEERFSPNGIARVSGRKWNLSPGVPMGEPIGFFNLCWIGWKACSVGFPVFIRNIWENPSVG